MSNPYSVLFTETEEGFLVEIPDLNICTQGRDLVDALYMSVDLISLWMDVRLENGEELPAPSAPDAIDISAGTFAKDGPTFLSVPYAYPACILHEIRGYSVIFPDLSVATCGDTKKEALRMAVDCLAGHIQWLQKEGEPLPAPSKYEDIDPAAIAAEFKCFTLRKWVEVVAVDAAEYAKRYF